MSHIFSSQDSTQVRLISSLSYCNPFLSDRIAYEKQALGDAYQTTHPAWNLHLGDSAIDVNVLLLVEAAEELAVKYRKQFLDQGNPSIEDRILYRDLVLFVIFHKLAPEFDQTIGQAHRNRAGVQKITYYGRYESMLHDFFGNRESLFMNDPAGGNFSREHVFSCFFQIRRAFYHIFYFFLGTSSAATRLRARVWHSIFTHDLQRYRRSLYNRMGDYITLITGPSGSGKELVAQAIGLSRYIPFNRERCLFEADFYTGFYPLNLSALSPTLIESELFGHRRGAFTGALQDHKGYFEVCGTSGSVFLDEIGEVSSEIQIKLLRVLQTRQFRPLGMTDERPFRGKAIAATNRDLAKEMQEGRFREDFYYRLCSDRIVTPSLFELIDGSTEELRYLVKFIATRMAGKEEAEVIVEDVTSWVTSELGMDYPWRGNFRELEQCVRNIVINKKYHPDRLLSQGATDSDDPLTLFENLELSADQLMARYVLHAWQKLGTYQDTARKLNLDRRTVKKYVEMARQEVE